MANVKNFGLVGVGSDLQFGKAGVRLINNSGTFNFKAVDGSTDADLTSRGITSSSGNVTLTTGNVVLSDTSGVLNIGGSTLSRHVSGVLQADGSAAFMVPVGNAAARPTGVTGMVRVANDSSPAVVEYFDGTSWTPLATGGNAAALQQEVDNIEASLGTMVTSNGVWVNSALNNSNVWPTPPTDLTSALNTMAAKIITDNSLNEIFPATGAGNVIYADGGNMWAQASPGSTSGVQAWNAKLDSISSDATNGILVQTSSTTVASRSLVAPVRGFTINDANGVSGNPTFVLANNLAALESLSSAPFGYISVVSDGVMAMRTLQGVSGQIAITNGDGGASNTDIGLATVTQGSGSSFVKVTLDSYGRVTGNTAVSQGDLTGLLGTYYLQTAGGSMTGSITMTGGSTVTGLPSPSAASDAANKAYVDAAVQGLNVHSPAETMAYNLTTDPQFNGAAYSNGTAGVGATLTAASNANINTAGVGGYSTLSVGSRILVNCYTSGSTPDWKKNGIYVVTDLGSAGTPWILTRSSDYDNSVAGEVKAGDFVFVQEGTYASTGWVETKVGTGTNDAIVIGTDPIQFTQFSGAGTYQAGTGLSLTGTTFSVNLGAGIEELPTGDVGIDLYTPSSGGIILTTDGTTRSTAANSQLALLLPAGSGLTQDTTGLYVPNAGITNAMLANSSVTLNADAGSGSLSLGGTLLIEGTAAQGISTSVSGSTYTITASNATSLQKGVAKFDSGSFTVTSGNVTLNTVDVAHGGTGQTSFATGQILYGAGPGNPIATSANLTFDNANTVTIGGALPVSIDGSQALISATATNSDLTLIPNGTGSVIIGPVGNGLIQSDVGAALTVRGNNGLTLGVPTAGYGITVSLPSGTSALSKVSITGPTAADYATNLGANDLTNKQYVDTAIASGAAAGAIKAFMATVPLNTNGTTNIGTPMPAGATVLRVKVNVTVVDTGATLSVGKSGNVTAYMTTGENDAQTTGLYLAECFVTEAGSVQLIGTVASSSGSGSGSCVVMVEYQVAQ